MKFSIIVFSFIEAADAHSVVFRGDRSIFRALNAFREALIINRFFGAKLASMKFCAIMHRRNTFQWNKDTLMLLNLFNVFKFISFIAFLAAAFVDIEILLRGAVLARMQFSIPIFRQKALNTLESIIVWFFGRAFTLVLFLAVVRSTCAVLDAFLKGSIIESIYLIHTL